MYCEIGTISLFLAQKAKKVYGVEIVPQAIDDARHNAEINGITNAEFFVGKAEEVVPDIYKKRRRRLPRGCRGRGPTAKGLRSGASGYSGSYGAGTYRLRELRPGNPGEGCEDTSGEGV